MSKIPVLDEIPLNVAKDGAKILTQFCKLSNESKI